MNIKDYSNTGMKLYAIWKNKEVIGYINLTDEQANILNSNNEINLYFGFDDVIKPELYAERESDK